MRGESVDNMASPKTSSFVATVVFMSITISVGTYVASAIYRGLPERIISPHPMTLASAFILFGAGRRLRGDEGDQVIAVRHAGVVCGNIVLDVFLHPERSNDNDNRGSTRSHRGRALRPIRSFWQKFGMTQRPEGRRGAIRDVGCPGENLLGSAIDFATG